MNVAAQDTGDPAVRRSRGDRPTRRLRGMGGLSHAAGREGAVEQGGGKYAIMWRGENDET